MNGSRLLPSVFVASWQARPSSFANVGGYGGPGGGGSGGNIALIGDSITLAETALVEATGGFGGGGPGPG